MNVNKSLNFSYNSRDRYTYWSWSLIFITVSSIFWEYSTCIQIYLFLNLFLKYTVYISFLNENDFTCMYIYYQYTFDAMNLQTKIWIFTSLPYRIYFLPYIYTSYKSSYLIIINIAQVKRIKARMPSLSLQVPIYMYLYKSPVVMYMYF